MFLLPGFSSQSGLKVGLMFSAATEQIEATNGTLDGVIPKLFSSSIGSNVSEFTICLRFRLHYHRPEYALISAYVQNNTAVTIG